VFLDDADRVDEAAQAIEQAAERPDRLTDWRQRNRTFFAALEVERNVMFIILMLIVLVAALNIISGLIMLVKDKSSDIAILRTMGRRAGAIMRVFLITGASIGISERWPGFGLGLLIAANIQSLQTSSPGRDRSSGTPPCALPLGDPRGDQSGEVTRCSPRSPPLLATSTRPARRPPLDPVRRSLR
jgi:ABC-type lipoprotein release transport system permease subunit